MLLAPHPAPAPPAASPSPTPSQGVLPCFVPLGALSDKVQFCWAHARIHRGKDASGTLNHYYYVVVVVVMEKSHHVSPVTIPSSSFQRNKTKQRQNCTGWFFLPLSTLAPILSDIHMSVYMVDLTFFNYLFTNLF